MLAGSRKSVTALSLTALVCLSVFATERLIQFCVDRLWHQERILTTDPVLGWKYIPNKSTVRRNTDGELWSIHANSQGFRSAETWDPAARRRILVLGDSYGVGHGVNLEDRFDSVLTQDHPDWSVMNLSVMGYGTDQELLSARPWTSFLQPGDVLLLVTYGNDFYDILRRSFSGRSKPWFSEEPGSLKLHPPEMRWTEKVRERSYIWSKLFEALEPGRDWYAMDVERALRLYRELILQELAPLARRGVVVVIAHAGDDWLVPIALPNEPDVKWYFVTLGRDVGARVVALDEVINDASCGGRVQKDLHWNARGHRAVAETLEALLQRPPRSFR
jgi:hypothetical protein